MASGDTPGSPRKKIKLEQSSSIHAVTYASSPMPDTAISVKHTVPMTENMSGTTSTGDEDVLAVTPNFPQIHTSLDTAEQPSMTTVTPDSVLEQIEKERACGIMEFVSPDLLGFSGVLKKRYTDFMVHEILPSGEVVHLTSLKAPKKTQQKTEESEPAVSISTREDSTHEEQSPQKEPRQLGQVLGTASQLHSTESASQVTIVKDEQGKTQYEEVSERYLNHKNDIFTPINVDTYPSISDIIPLDDHVVTLSCSVKYDLFSSRDNTSQPSASASSSIAPLLPHYHTSPVSNYLHFASFPCIAMPHLDLLPSQDCVDPLAHHFQTPLPHQRTVLPHLSTETKSSGSPKASPSKETRTRQQFYLHYTGNGWAEVDKAKKDEDENRKLHGRGSSEGATLDEEPKNFVPKKENTPLENKDKVDTKTDQFVTVHTPQASTRSQWQAYADSNGESNAIQQVSPPLVTLETSLKTS